MKKKQFNNNDMLQLPGFVIHYLSFFPQLRHVFIGSLDRLLMHEVSVTNK